MENTTLLKQSAEYSNIDHMVAMVNALPVLAYTLAPNTKIISGNAEAMRLFKVKSEKELSNLTMDIYEPETKEILLKEIELVLKTKKTLITERLVIFRTGEQIWLKIRRVPVLDKNNEVKEIIVFGRDISIEKKAQKQRETYISTLSHDLKIPALAQIRALELLKAGSLNNLTDEQKELVDLTLDSCRFMHEMLSTILTTYKYENKEITLYHECIDVLKIINEIFTKAVKPLQDKNIQVRMRIKDDDSVIFADRIQIKKAFENLIDQCVSSAYENTEIICELKKLSDDKLHIALTFESPYVSTETLKNMFKMYSSAENKMDKVGCSLNLYLAKQIIEAHEGTIFVESYETNNSTYSIELPCVNECKIPTKII